MDADKVQNLREAAQKIREAIRLARSTAVTCRLYKALGLMAKAADVSIPPQGKAVKIFNQKFWESRGY